MAILWCGGEDIDFNGSVSVITTGGDFRSGYARCAICAGTQTKSNVFASGAVTSAWLSFRMWLFTNTKNGRLIGLVNSGTLASGLWIGTSAASQTQIALHKFDGTTQTQLAVETGNSLGGGTAAGLYKIDVQLANYGSSSTVNVYVNGGLVISYSGSTAISGVASLDCVGLFFIDSTSGNSGASEIIVADEPTLGFQGLVTLAPNGNGATQTFSNPAYTNFNPTTINDVNSTYTNTTGQDEQVTLNGLPSGSFQVRAVRVAARALVTTGATPTGLKLGFNNTNTSTVAEGASHVLSAGFETVEDIFNTDPTSAGGTGDWGADLSGYQLEIKSS